MPHMESTRGCTMPEPPSSSQSLPVPNLIWFGTERSQRKSHSTLGSVKGKKDGRARNSTRSTSKNALQNSSMVHLRCPKWVSSSITSSSNWWNIGEWVASESTRYVRPGETMRIGGFCDSMVRTCTGEVRSEERRVGKEG